MVTSWPAASLGMQTSADRLAQSIGAASFLALFANSLRCNGASAAEGRPTVARLASSRQPVTQSRHSRRRMFSIFELQEERRHIRLMPAKDTSNNNCYGFGNCLGLIV